MGRDITGAITVGRCLQLRISDFKKIINVENLNKFWRLSWESGESIGIRMKEAKGSYILELEYQKTKDDEKVIIKYQIWIVGRPSNLGKGTVYYFNCPFRGYLCRVLYMGYGSDYFKSREAYQHRIYYASQLSSRLDKHNDKYWSLENKLKTLYKKHPKSHYRGNETKPSKRISELEKKQRFHEEMRWRILPVAVSKSLLKNGLQVEDFF